MNYLIVEGLSKAYHEKVLFHDVSFALSKGQKVALIARNGSGKSTLLRLITGLEAPDQGTVQRSREVTSALVLQNPEFNPEHQVLDAVFDSAHPTLKAIRAYEESLLNDDAQQQQRALEQMDKLHAWSYQVKIKQILSQLKIGHLTQKVGVLSGGQQRRIALAKALIDDPDFLILDEPTNHLDLEMIEWLEEYLRTQVKTVLMVTHDRYFLERVCDEILELDQGQIYRYQGNYEQMLEVKAVRLESEAREMAAAQNLYRRELEWMRRQPQARQTKARAREDAFYELEKKVQRQAREATLQLDVQMSRLGNSILDVKHLSKAYGDLVLFNDFSFLFSRHDRIGIVGGNGTGKTTFLELLTGNLPADSGTRESGETVVFGYYRQDGLQLPEDKRVIEVVRDVAEYLPLAKGKQITAMQLLERFLFPPAMQYNYVSSLSGGEKRRLYLLTLLMKNPNFLVLDEPTNDFDIETIQVLEAFLQDFPGCLMVVSHDRTFMDKLVNRLFVFEGQGVIRDFPGTYSDFRELREAEEEFKRLQEKQAKQPVERKKTDEGKPKLSWKQQRELEQLEKDLETLGQRKQEVGDRLNRPGLSLDEITRLSKEFGNLETELATKEERWMELAELA